MRPHPSPRTREHAQGAALLFSLARAYVSGMKTILSDRAVIAVSGAQARTFLQGLITNDIGKLAPDTPLYAALLTPQGKILFDFLLYQRDATTLIDCTRVTAEAFQKRLSMYRLRAKVEIARRDDLAVIASWSGDKGALRDPR